MMGKQDKPIQMIILDMDSIIPENHLLRRIKNCINFDFIYEKASPYYAKNGRKSIDPVVLIKMLLIGYLYGIKSERRLEEVSLNLAYRWFCDIDLMQKVPDHSIFKNGGLRLLVYSVRFSMKLCCSASNRTLYLMKLVLQMVLFFPQMFHGTVDTKQ